MSLALGLEVEVIRAFLDELRKDDRFKEHVVAKLEKMLNSQSVTKKNLLELIGTNATLQNKKS